MVLRTSWPARLCAVYETVNAVLAVHSSRVRCRKAKSIKGMSENVQCAVCGRAARADRRRISADPRV